MFNEKSLDKLTVVSHEIALYRQMRLKELTVGQMVDLFKICVRAGMFTQSSSSNQSEQPAKEKDAAILVKELEDAINNEHNEIRMAGRNTTTLPKLQVARAAIVNRIEFLEQERQMFKRLEDRKWNKERK